MDDGVGLVKGVLMGLVEPSTVALRLVERASEGPEMEGVAGTAICPFARFSFLRSWPLGRGLSSGGLLSTSCWPLSAIFDG